MIKIFLTSLILGFILYPYFIRLMKRINQDGQPIRLVGPAHHIATKKNVPTMGGIVILFSAIASILLWMELTTKIVLFIFTILSFTVLGFVDDYLKLKTKNHRGLSAKIKILIQITIAVTSMLLLNSDHFSKICLFRSQYIDIGYFYLPFTVFVIVGAANAVNLTDGLDGLAATQAITSFISLSIVAYLIVEDNDVIFFSIAFIGAILSFLWFNAHPAKIFMGDVGSLGIGTALGLISILIKREILFSIIGIIFVIETLSVIIQISYFKYTKGKRIFLMSPIHHHFEEKGWSETTIVTRFWIISIISSIFSIIFLL
ncbi:MAG: phospho-N-acetylmuramoyl-pentapeptide-transferase [Wolbachia endosymbiont of Fragariocoptes setiger]|nr:phospho-N-acetylmuramoyl-pentapeptide-transferase [Wolbachia endosymbiont of Fragariocoptes setiger]